MKKEVAFILLVLLITPIVNAKKGHMQLLAISQTKEGLRGAGADLDLEIKPGIGRVFISTFPLTKVDTQLSFRIAKEYACDFLSLECNNYDFFYEVRSDAPIVGGPSAGAAATALTIIVLEDLTADPSATVTGTIESGGMIGPVAGIKEKIEAAQRLGLRTVLIPEGKRYQKDNNSNSTIDLVEYGAELEISVAEVIEIRDVILLLTGFEFAAESDIINIDSQYTATMMQIANGLCERSKTLLMDINISYIKPNNLQLEEAANLTSSATNALENGEYYAAASYCFGANVKYQYLRLASKDLSIGRIEEMIAETQEFILTSKQGITGFQYATITDLQTYLIVSERLKEAQQYLEESSDELEYNNTDNAVYNLAFAVERWNSAVSWSQFFGMDGRQFAINDKSLRQLCIQKVSEATERLEYTKSFISVNMDELSKDLDVAEQDMMLGNNELCIFRASKVKARASLILSSISISKDEVEEFLQKKLTLARRTIVKETRRDIFPILGYSYYEYAESLSHSDPFSSLLYAELALELSSFDMYFKNTRLFSWSFDLGTFTLILGSMLVGYALAVVIFRWELQKKKRKK
ncbi:MAG: S16 family serine protease [Candidatus Woesearchaeota archaeon]